MSIGITEAQIKQVKRGYGHTSNLELARATGLNMSQLARVIRDLRKAGEIPETPKSRVAKARKLARENKPSVE